MAATLYDPAFAVISRLFAANYRRAITMLTLFGGFASTVFWPLTQFLIAEIGWRQALLVLAALNLIVCVPVHWRVPFARGSPGPTPGDPSRRPDPMRFARRCARPCSTCSRSRSPATRWCSRRRRCT